MVNNLFFTVSALLGQLIVVMFLFYSGYGIYEQVKAKGKSYVRSFLPHRFLPTYASFAICVFFYFVLSLVLRADYPVRQVLLSFIGWESIGNSIQYGEPRDVKNRGFTANLDKRQAAELPQTKETHRWKV